jgi:hypothetical protein
MNSLSIPSPSSSSLQYNNTASPLLFAHVAPCRRIQRRSKHYVPQSLDLETRVIDAGFVEWIEPDRIRKLTWLVSKICKAWHVNETTKVGFFVNVSAKEMRKKLHWRFAVKVVKVLVALGVVEVNGGYSPGDFPKSFRLSKEYWHDPLKVIDGGARKYRATVDSRQSASRGV